MIKSAFVLFSILLLGVPSISIASTELLGGKCYYPSTGEEIKLVKTDSITHYGMFAQGTSSIGERVYLAEEFIRSKPAVMIGFQGQKADSYSLVQLQKNESTLIVFGIAQAPELGSQQWLECHLEVR